MNILEIQERLPWSLGYGEGFKLSPTTYTAHRLNDTKRLLLGATVL